MKITKNQKIMLGVGAVGLIILWFILRRKKNNVVTGYDNAAPSYLSVNMPQPGTSGFTLPGFGNNYFGGVNTGSGCNGCDTGNGFVSENGLAQSMAGVDTGTYNDAIASALQSMPSYMQANIAASYKSGSITQGNYDALSVVPVLALGSGTTNTSLYAPAGISGDV